MPRSLYTLTVSARWQPEAGADVPMLDEADERGARTAEEWGDAVVHESSAMPLFAEVQKSAPGG